MAEINLRWYKQLLLSVLILSGIVGLVRYHFAKKEFESRAMIEVVKQCSEESFENFKYCVRPMFASHREFALKIWRKERRGLLSKLGSALRMYNDADEEVRQVVQGFVLAVERLDLSCQLYAKPEIINQNRKNFLKGLRKMDAVYEEFSVMAEKYGFYVHRIKYTGEYM